MTTLNASAGAGLALDQRRGLVRGPVAELGITSANGAKGTKKQTLHGIMVPFGVWIEIDSFVEGHFMEVFMEGSMDKTFADQRTTMRCILHHGRSGTPMGKMPIGKVTDLHANQTAAYYEAELFDGLPDWLLEGFENGAYGTSVKYECVRPDYRRRPGKAAHNPTGLDELRVVEAKVVEFGPTPFPVYKDAKAGLRSMTDDWLLAEMAEDPERMKAFAERAGLKLVDAQASINTPHGGSRAIDMTPSTATNTTNFGINAGQNIHYTHAVEEPRTARRHERAAEYVGSVVWAMHPTVLATALKIIGERVQGYRPSKDEIDERLGRRAFIDEEGTSPSDPQAPVKVIGIRGPIVPHAGMMADVSSPGRSIEDLQGELRAAMADDKVNAILLDIDSPGGSADLVEELAIEIRDMRERKQITAIANTWAASAAYYLASQASEVVVTPSGEVGSIGVYSAHQDVSELQKMQGVKTSIVSAGKYKVEGNPFEPLTDEAREEMQSKIDAIYKMFVSAVAKGRDVSAKTVESDFGQGRMVMASKAVELGMADRVATFDQTLARLEKLKPPVAPERAAAPDELAPEREQPASTPADPRRSTRSPNYLERRKPKWHL